MHTGARALAAAAIAAALLAPAAARAQATGTVQPQEPVEARGAGVAGGIIGGAELSLFVLSFADVKPVWPWIAAPIVTAAGGGVGGYYLEKESAGGAIALLVSSMALLIPATIAVSIARAYEIEEGGRKTLEGDKARYPFEGGPGAGAPAGPETTIEVERPEGGADAEPSPDEGAGETGAEPPAKAPETPAAPDGPGPAGSRARHLASGSILHIGADGGAGFGVPAIDVRPVVFHDDAPLRAPRTGLEVRIPLLRVELP